MEFFMTESPRHVDVPAGGEPIQTWQEKCIPYLPLVALVAAIVGIWQCVMAGSGELSSMGIGFLTISLLAAGVWHWRKEPHKGIILAIFYALGFLFYGLAQGSLLHKIGIDGGFFPHGQAVLGGSLIAFAIATALYFKSTLPAPAVDEIVLHLTPTTTASDLRVHREENVPTTLIVDPSVLADPGGPLDTGRGNRNDAPSSLYNVSLGVNGPVTQPSSNEALSTDGTTVLP